MGGGKVSPGIESDNKPSCDLDQLVQIRDAYAEGARAIKRALHELGKLRRLIKKDPKHLDGYYVSSEGLRRAFGMPQRMADKRISKLGKIPQIEWIYDNLKKMNKSITTLGSRGNKPGHFCRPHLSPACDRGGHFLGALWWRKKNSIVFCGSFFDAKPEEQQRIVFHETVHRTCGTIEAEEDTYGLYIGEWKPHWNYSWAVTDSYAEYVMYAGRKKGSTK